MEESPGEEESGGVGGGEVGEAGGESVLPEFLGVGGAEDFVALDGGVDDLGDDPCVGDSGD